MHYSIVIHKDNDSDYGVAVPDIPGCFSAGETYEEALSAAQEAIECHIYVKKHAMKNRSAFIADATLHYVSKVAKESRRQRN